MADFHQFCNQFSPLETEAADELFEKVTTRKIKKGALMLKPGQVCTHLFFIQEGFAKMSFIKNDKEFIMRFFSENRIFSAFERYLTQTHSKYMIVAQEDTTVTLINQAEMEKLCNKYHCMETFLRKLVSIASVKMTKRISEMLEEEATESYNRFDWKTIR